MKFLGFEIDFGRECEGCTRLRIENTSLRLQLQTMGEHQVELLDEIHRLRGSKSDPEEVRR